MAIGTIRVETLDEIVLSGLKGRLMDPGIYEEFLKGFIAKRNAQYVSALKLHVASA